jgi:hypothetical protein
VDKDIAVFGGGNWRENGDSWKLGVELGKYLATRNFRVITGGYGGAMEAVSQGAVEAGGKTKAFLHSPVEIKQPNRFIQEFTVCEDYMDRMASLLRIPDAIALPGESGTFAEITVSLTMIQKHPDRHLAIWKPFWFEKVNLMELDLSSLSTGNKIKWFTETGELDEWIDLLYSIG